MTDANDSTFKQLAARAVENAREAIDSRKRLPEVVFAQKWRSFFFCESDRVFASEFACVLRQLLRDEGAHVASFVSIDKQALEQDHVRLGVAYLRNTISESTYLDMLRDGGPDCRLFSNERYVLASDVGEWCIYCEKSNDIAVIGFSNQQFTSKHTAAMQLLWAKPIKDLLLREQTLFPFSGLTPAWRQGLLTNYD